MLYDKKWDFKTKADPLSIEALISWLEKQPADAAYQWGDARHCLIGQWLQSTGIPDSSALGKQSVEIGRQSPFGEIALSQPYTFGAALKRARAADQ